MIIKAHHLIIGGDHLPGPMDRERINDLIEGRYIDERPLTVYQIYPLLWCITNGRHRFISGLIKGKTEFDCDIRTSLSERRESWQSRVA